MEYDTIYMGSGRHSDALIIIPWERVEELCSILAAEIRRLYPCPERLCIAGIAYGGLVPAALVTRELRASLVAIRPTGGINPGKRETIVIDEICDTGKTLQKLRRSCEGRFTAMTLHCKSRSSHIPDYTAEIIPGDGWVHYPWEELPAI